MRLTSLRLALLFGAALFLLGPSTAFTQKGKSKGGFGPPSDNGGGSYTKRDRGGPPTADIPGATQPGGGGPGGSFGRGPGGPGGGPGGPGGGPGGPGGGSMDPASWATRSFDRYANGGNVINISDYQSKMDPQANEKLQTWAKSKGINSGQVTRDQFSQFYQEQVLPQMSQMMAARGITLPGVTPPAAAATQDLDKEAEDSFKRRDRDNLGYITKDQANSTLRDDWDKYDKNKDGKITLDEYKEYYKARMSAARGGSADPNTANIVPGTEQPSQDDGKRPTVYHAGNLPKELPAWFVQFDTDRDGQVGLYEWKKGGGNTVEFMKYDMNGDGFLTVEEVLRYQKAALVLAKKATDQSPGSVLAYDENGEPIEGIETPTIPNIMGNRGGRGGPGGGGGPGGSMRGPGGPGGGPGSGSRGQGGPGAGPGGGGMRGPSDAANPDQPQRTKGSGKQKGSKGGGQ